jgi:hypothetical protein
LENLIYAIAGPLIHQNQTRSKPDNDMKPESNIKLRSNLNQGILMLIVILVGMLFSQLAKAQGPNYEQRFVKAKYRTTVHSNSVSAHE